MSWSRRLCVALGLIVSNAAFAADMPGTLPPPSVAPILPPLTSWAPAWYLRGDIGGYWGRVGAVQTASGTASPTDNDLGNGFVGGVGAGFKSGWIRADVTVDYTAMKYTGSVTTPGDLSGKIDAVTALFNGYLDLGSWYGISPYLGAGAGVANLRTHDFSSTAAALPITAGLSRSDWKFAYAVMAGVGYSIAPNLTVDAGYRYVNFGDVTTASDTAGALTLKNLAAHEVRVGVRWSFDDLVH